MLSVSRQPSSPTVPPSSAAEEVKVRDSSGSSGEMDLLLAKLKRNMVELILQGDDVTRQMWQMYTVFEEIFGLHKAASKSAALVKPIVVGDRIKQQLTSEPQSQITHNESDCKAASTTSPSHTTGATFSTSITTTNTTSTSSSSSSASAATATTVSSTETTTVTAITTISSPSAGTVSLPPPTVSCESGASTEPPEKCHETEKTNRVSHSKVNQRQSTNDYLPHLPTTNIHQQFPQSSGSPESSQSSAPTISLSRTSNPLLDTIGVLTTGSNPDSDDSDLDIVYQQLRYRGRQRKPEQVRIRTQRSHHRHHQHFANSDPESTSYAGSNSIDSGYKSQCATPEVSDSLVGAPEVRRSASDVSASDSSTTSGRPRSSDDDPKSTKIKMGTRAIAGKIINHHFHQGTKSRHHPQPPLLESSMSDVTLDHLMYLRQSLRKDRQDYFPTSSHGSGPSSSASSTVRDELSPSAITDEESGGWSDKPRMGSRRSPVQHQKPYAFLPPPKFPPSESPYLDSIASKSIEGGPSRPRARRMSAGDTPLPEASGGSSPSDFLFSGMEYYDLDSIQEFPHRRSSYVAPMEEKSRHSRMHMLPAPKRDVSQDRRFDQAYKKKKDYGAYRVPPPPMDMDHYYDMQRRSPRDVYQYRPHHPPSHHHADSKLTEAAIRVLEMIEDFRMEEALGNTVPFDKPDSRGKYSSHLGPHAFVPRFRRTTTTTTTGTRATGLRPASTGSLIADTRSVATTAEHHVYEEIMYDLVCERSSSRLAEPMPPPERTSKSRNRLLPVSPHAAAHSSSMQQHHGYRAIHPPDMARMTVRSHKHHRSSNLYSLVSDHDSRNVDKYLDVDWGVSRGRRENLSPEFPV